MTASSQETSQYLSHLNCARSCGAVSTCDTYIYIGILFNPFTQDDIYVYIYYTVTLSKNTPVGGIPMGYGIREEKIRAHIILYIRLTTAETPVRIV